MPKKKPSQGDVSPRLEGPGSHQRIEQQSTTSRAELSLYSESFEGPLPHPSLLQQYDAISPGISRFFVEQVVVEGAHRRELEKNEQVARISYERSALQWDAIERLTGQLFAFLIASIFVGVGAYTALNDHPVAGSILGVGGLGGVISTFIYGRSKYGSRAIDAPAENDEPARAAGSS